MTATSPKALEKKLNNRKSKKDMGKEKKIYELGGKTIDIVYGYPLTEEMRKQRTEYLYDLLYPKRKVKRELTNKRGRPRKYENKEQQKLANRKRWKDQFDTNKGHTSKWARHTPIYRSYMAAKTRASKANIPFDLTPEYLLSILPEDLKCPVFDIPFKENTPYALSLDKFKPELGYTQGNVYFISRKANMIKNDGTLEEILALYKWMKKITLTI